MQQVQVETHLAISSFFDTAAGYAGNTTFKVFRRIRYGRRGWSVVRTGTREGKRWLMTLLRARDDDLTPSEKVGIERDRARPQQKNRNRYGNGA